MRYLEAIEYLAAEHHNEAVVITGGYDEDITDHLGDIRDATEEGLQSDPDVVMEESSFANSNVEVSATTIRVLKADGFIDYGEALAHVVSAIDYETLNKE